MHICNVTPVFYPDVTGLVIRVYKDILAMNKEGHRITVVSPQVGTASIPCYHVRSRRSQLISFPLAVLKVHKKTKVDVIWVNNYYLIIPLFFLAKLIGAKLVCEIHGPERKEANAFGHSSKKIIYNIIYYFDEILLRWVDKIIIVEKELSAWLGKELKIPKAKTVFIANYPDLSFFKPQKKRKKKSFVVGYLGTLQRGRINPLLSTMQRMKDDIEFLIVGEGDDEKKIIHFQKTNENVDYYVEKDYQKIPQVIGKFDLGVVLSLGSNIVFWEKGPPMKLFEYLACGVPVLAVNIPNLKSLIEGNGVGLVVEKNGLKEGIEKIRNNYSWYKNNVLKFRSKMENKYSWSREKIKIINVLSQIKPSFS